MSFIVAPIRLTAIRCEISCIKNVSGLIIMFRGKTLDSVFKDWLYLTGFDGVVVPAEEAGC